MNHSSVSKIDVNSSCSRGATTENPGESGWTDYLYDNSNSNQRDEEDSSCYSLGTPSLVSDAASFPTWKSSNSMKGTGTGTGTTSPISTSVMPNKLSFIRKTRTKELISHDYSDLEDTASSPVNSPKVVKRPSIEHFSTSMGKSAVLVHQHKEMNFNNGEIDDHDLTKLNKRELCFVPFSTLVNYIG